MHGGFFPIRGGTFSSMANVPAHGELFGGGVMDEKCRIILHINLLSSNGELFSYQHVEMHCYTASLNKIYRLGV